MAKEIISMVSLPCSGANPESQLPIPVNVTIDIDNIGNRRVGCPYLKEWRSSTSPRRGVFICEATKDGYKDSIPTLEEIKKRVQNEVGNDTEENLWDLVMPEFVQKFPGCFHKTPL